MGVELRSLAHILKQGIFTEDFLLCNSFAAIVWLRILIKCWDVLTKNEKHLDGCASDMEKCKRANEIMVDIVEGLELWISMRKNSLNYLKAAEIAYVQPIELQENRWVSEVSWNLSLRTTNTRFRQRLLCVAGQSLMIASNEEDDFRNNDCASQILFCLIMELATLIQMFQDSPFDSKETGYLEDCKENLADRADCIIRQGFKILSNMRSNLGIRTKRILLVYIVKGTLLTSQNTDYCREILNDVVKYNNSGNTDFLLPQLISAVLSSGPQTWLPEVNDYTVTLLKQSIEASISDGNEPKQELMPACFSLIDHLMLKYDIIEKNEKEEIIRIMGRVVQYICLAFKKESSDSSYSNETNDEIEITDYNCTSNPYERYVMAILIKLWNKSIAIELKSGYKSIAMVNSQIKFKEFAKMLGKLLPQNSKVFRMIVENEIDDNKTFVNHLQKIMNCAKLVLSLEVAIESKRSDDVQLCLNSVLEYSLTMDSISKSDSCEMDLKVLSSFLCVKLGFLFSKTKKLLEIKTVPDEVTEFVCNFLEVETDGGDCVTVTSDIVKESLLNKIGDVKKIPCNDDSVYAGRVHCFIRNLIGELDVL